MGRKEQRERERKKAAKGSHALSGFGFLPRKRSWSDGDLNATATSQRQLVEEDSSSRSSRQLQEQDEGSSLQSSSSTQVSVKLIVIFVPAGPQNVSPVLNGLARLRATAKFQITPAAELVIFGNLFLFHFLVCLHVEGDFVFSFLLPFGTSSRTPLQVRPPLTETRQNQQAAPACSKVIRRTISGRFFKTFFSASVLESHPENDIGALFQNLFQRQRARKSSGERYRGAFSKPKSRGVSEGCR